MGTRCNRLGIAALSLILGLVVSVGVLAGTVFPDPVGDVTGGLGPDVTSISVSHTSAAVTFRFRFAKAPPLGVSTAEGWVDMLLIGIDVPPRGLKRGPHGWTGIDYNAGLHGTDRVAVVVRVPSRQPGRREVVARPKVVISGRTLSFSVPRSKLGSPAWIDFAVATGREMSNESAGGGADYAPARGTFHYQLRR